MNIVIFGLSMTSSWGNGHATTYRGLVKGLSHLGHSVLFLERNMPWYQAHRDCTSFSFARCELYESVAEAFDRFRSEIETADVVVVGSFVPEGPEVCESVLRYSGGTVAFYDIDTPVTLRKLSEGDGEYLTPELIPRFDLYLSFTGGPVLKRLEQEYGAIRARPLYCAVDPDLYAPVVREQEWELGYLGTFSADRQPKIQSFFLDAAKALPEKKFALGGSGYDVDETWPVNVRHIDHIPPDVHPFFYCSQRFTLNVTREEMVQTGFAPSVRLFEAASCGVPILTDYWAGLEEFFSPGVDILVVRETRDVLDYLTAMKEETRLQVAELCRAKVLARHTCYHRAAELEGFIGEMLRDKSALSIQRAS